MYNYYQNMMLSDSFSWLYFFVLVDLILKGIALYKSAGRKQIVWFVALLLVNSLGILPAIYLLYENSTRYKVREAADTIIRLGKTKKSKRKVKK